MTSNRMSIRPSIGGESSGLRVVPDAFKKKLMTIAAETVDSLQEIWKEAGYEDTECQGLLGDLLSKIKNVCAVELATEQQILEHAKLQVSSKVAEYSEKCLLLGRNCDSINSVKGANYADKLAELEKLISVITVEVSRRKALLNTELEKIQECISSLGDEMPSMHIFDGADGTPELSDVRLHLMRDYNATLAQRKLQRQEEICALASEALQISEDLVLGDNEIIDSCSSLPALIQVHASLLDIKATGEWTSGIHIDDLNNIVEYLKLLNEEKESRREELTSTGAEIARLWTLLRIPRYGNARHLSLEFIVA